MHMAKTFNFLRLPYANELYENKGTNEVYKCLKSSATCHSQPFSKLTRNRNALSKICIYLFLNSNLWSRVKNIHVLPPTNPTNLDLHDFMQPHAYFRYMLRFPSAACVCKPRGFIEQTCTNVHVFRRHTTIFAEFFLHLFSLPYKFYVLGQIGLSKQCRPRSDCF